MNKRLKKLSNPVELIKFVMIGALLIISCIMLFNKSLIPLAKARLAAANMFLLAALLMVQAIECGIRTKYKRRTYIYFIAAILIAGYTFKIFWKVLFVY
ncbi:hypothetical protein ACFIJ5_03905 [Haloimpatiens sp. FM7330]|uniref:hypothetical protein n=1 Tax=Haloimpatiens sp. FM7330 TaxID=3298610 RepID=UPI003632C1A0